MVHANELFLDDWVMLLYVGLLNISLSKHQIFISYASIRQKVGLIFKARNNYLGLCTVNGEAITLSKHKP